MWHLTVQRHPSAVLFPCTLTEVPAFSIYLSLMKFGVAAAPPVSSPPVSSPHVPRNCPWNFCTVGMGAPSWIIERIFPQWSAIWLNEGGRWELFPIAPVLFSRDQPRGVACVLWRAGHVYYRHSPSPPFPSFIISLILFFLRLSVAHAALSAPPVILQHRLLISISFSQRVSI